jgi:hypothetical protein
MLTGTGLVHTRESAERRYEILRQRARNSAQRYARQKTQRRFKFKAFLAARKSPIRPFFATCGAKRTDTLPPH